MAEEEKAGTTTLYALVRFRAVIKEEYKPHIEALKKNPLKFTLSDLGIIFGGNANSKLIGTWLKSEKLPVFLELLVEPIEIKEKEDAKKLVKR